jgi:hypothetical protein
MHIYPNFSWWSLLSRVVSHGFIPQYIENAKIKNLLSLFLLIVRFSFQLEGTSDSSAYLALVQQFV